MIILRKPQKTSLTIFLTFIITSAMYLAAFVIFPALSAFLGSLSGSITGFFGGGNSELSSKIKQIDSYIEEGYINDVDQTKLNDMALRGYVAGLGDPYSQYFSKEEMEALSADLNGSYKGVGVEVAANENNEIEVLNVYKGGPADKGGMQAGDILTEVNGVKVNGDSLNEATNIIKGLDERGKSDKLKIKIMRNGEEHTLSIVREEIVVQSVSGKMLEGKIGYLQISSFVEETGTQFKTEAQKLVDDGAKSLIIDLRNNGGGMLDAVVEVADYLLPEGDILTIKGKNTKPEVYTSDERAVNLPMCVLTNGNSASASEVLAGALRDHKKAVLVGEKTYGKGVVQTLFPFDDGSAVKITTAKYYTPSGECIDKVGITPDVEVKMELTKALSLYTEEEDIQLQEAIKQLK